MLIHYGWFNGTEQSIWFYFVNKTGKSIKKITWVVKVNGAEDELELNCEDGYDNSNRIYDYIFRTRYTDLDYTGVHVKSATVTFSDGTILENPELKEEPKLRTQVANAESRRTTAYYVEPTQSGFGSKAKTNGSSGANSTPKEELIKEKKHNVTLGVICLFIFWPAAIYFFYKASKISKEIDLL